MPMGAAAVARGAGLRTMYLVLALVLCVDSLLGPWSPVSLDVFHQNIVKWAVLADLWTHGGWFEWFPNFAGGAPSMAGPLPPWSANVLYSLLLPPWLVQLLLRVGLLFSAGFGTFLLLHRFLEVPRARALLVGALYALSVANQPVIDVFTFVFPLFAAWGLEALTPGMSRPKRLLRGLAMLLVALSSLPGLTVPYFPALHLALVLFLLPAHLRTRPVLPGTLLLWTAYCLLYAPHFLGVLEYTPFLQAKAVAQVDIGALAAFFRGLADALLTPLSALFLLVLPTAARNRKVLAAAILTLLPALVAGLCGMGSGMLYVGSFLSGLEPTRALVLVGLGQMLTIGLGLPDVARRTPLARFWFLVCLCLPFGLGNFPLAGLSACLAVAGVAGEVYLDLRGQGRINAPRADWAWTFLSAAIAGACLLTVQQSLLADDSGFYARGFMRTPELQRMAEDMRETPQRVASADVHPSVVQLYGVETVGSEETPNRRWAELLLAAQAPLLERTPRARREKALFSVTRTMNKPAALDHSYSRPLYVDDWNWGLVRLMNVSRIVSSKPIDGIEGEARLAAFMRGGTGLPEFARETLPGRAYSMSLWIYEVRDPLPRAFCARQAVIVPADTVLHRMMEENGEGFRERVYIADSDVGDAGWPGDHARPASNCAAKLLEYSADRMLVEATADGPCFLVISANWNPSWQATVNGRPVPVLRANHSLMAVRIDGVGPFRVELTYENAFLDLMHLASLTGVLLSFAAFLLPNGGRPPVPTPLPTEAMAGQGVPASARGHSVRLLVLLLILWVAASLYLMPLPEQPRERWLVYYALVAAPATAVAAWFWTFLFNRRW